MRRRGFRRYLLPAVLTTAALTVGACGGSQETANQQPFKPTDVRFVQKMLPHHMQAVRTAQVEIENGGDPRVQRIALTILQGQKREIAQMQGFLKQFGARPQPTPADQRMVWRQDLADERTADSPEALDAIFLTNMIPHHSAAIPMAQVETEQGSFEPARKLAQEIKSTQRMEIKQMKALVREKAS